MFKADRINNDKAILSPEVSERWASVWMLVDRISEELMELADSEADGNGEVMYCDKVLLRIVSNLSSSLHTLFDVKQSDTASGSVATEDPQLDAKRLEHMQLARMITAIEDLCDDEDPLGHWDDVERRFREFVNALISHTRREAVLLTDEI